jgi:dTDP-glucose 4,6-dehydratase
MPTNCIPFQSVFVTGGAGFIGSAFVRRTVARDVRIVNFDNLTYAGRLESIASIRGRPEHVFVKGDISDAGLVRRLLAQHECDAIVHFAAESHVDRSIGSPLDFVQTNVVGTCQLLIAALDYWGALPADRRERFRFLHVSTDEVYGSLGVTGKFCEQTPYSPSSPYAASKASGDHFVRAFHRTFGLPVLITNCSNNYGPYQLPEKLIPLMILSALEGRPLPVYGDGANVRDWLFVDDHIEAIRRVLARGKPGETYSIGGECERTNLDIVRTICRLVDELRPDLPHSPCERLITFVNDRPGHDRRYAMDSTKIRRELGWQPDVLFEEGIRRTVAWYLERSDWLRAVEKDGHHKRRLGLVPPTNDSRAIHNQANRFTCEASPEIDGVQFRPLQRRCDARGWLVELFRDDELDSSLHPAMAYVSETEPGIVRGPHEHAHQTDYFAFVGPGDFRVYLWDARPGSATYGATLTRNVGESNPSVLIVPPGVVHAYENISDRPAWVFNAPNRLYAGPGRCEPVDEIRHEDRPDSPYSMDRLRAASLADPAPISK